MLTLEIPEKIESHVIPLAQACGKTAKEYIHDAFMEFLEDMEDLHEAEQALADIRSGKVKTLSSAEMRKELGLDD